MPCWSIITNTFKNFTSISISIIFRCTFNIGSITNNNFFTNIIIYWNWSNYPFNFNGWCITVETDLLTSPFVENNRCFLYSICFRTISILLFFKTKQSLRKSSIKQNYLHATCNTHRQCLWKQRSKDVSTWCWWKWTTIVVSITLKKKVYEKFSMLNRSRSTAWAILLTRIPV